jgi:hypothetical protein
VWVALGCMGIWEKIFFENHFIQTTGGIGFGGLD